MASTTATPTAEADEPSQAAPLSMASTAAPVSSDERVFALDFIRGVALLGIFVMNMPGFVASFYSGMVGFNHWPAWWDNGVQLLRNVLMGGKFNSMFSFLFGIGFTLQLGRMLERGPHGHVMYLRRLIALLAFGVLHACLFWTGDVLHIYAVLGLLLFLMRNASDRTLITLIVLCIIGPPLISVMRVVLGFSDDYALASHVFERWRASNNAAYGMGSFMDAAREHTREMVFLYTDRGSAVYVLSFYLQMATTLFIGVLAGRHRWVQNAAQLLPRMIILQRSMLVLGLASGAIYAYGETHELIFTSTLWSVGTPFAYVLCRLGLVTFYVIVLVRLTLREQWRGWLQPIATVGRMPLSNYLLQTLMATFIFYGWGLGFWNQGGPAIWFALALGLYLVVQIPLSLLWMKRFKYGPMEWLWRLLTYGYGALQRATPVHEVRAVMVKEIPETLQPVAVTMPQASEAPSPDDAAEPQRG